MIRSLAELKRRVLNVEIKRGDTRTPRVEGNCLNVTVYDGEWYPKYDVDENWSIYEIVKYDAPIGWGRVFRQLLNEAEQLDKLLKPPFLPKKQNLFRAFHLTPLNKVKVVIVGQDPYHDVFKGEPTAQGMSFSVPNGFPVKPSLRNIFRELNLEYGVMRDNNDLSDWAEQGVLMLNRTLTVLEKQPRSHSGLWDNFVNEIIREIAKYRKNCLFLLWGNEAAQVASLLAGVRYFMDGHPSPLAMSGRGKKFLGCGCFKKANQYLVERGESEIKWV